jgi:hypothetical protein
MLVADNHGNDILVTVCSLQTSHLNIIYIVIKKLQHRKNDRKNITSNSFFVQSAVFLYCESGRFSQNQSPILQIL